MPWDYLQDERWDERFKVAATWLEDHTLWCQTETIVDLNCGTARLARYLDSKVYFQYIGNDKHAPYIREALQKHLPVGYKSMLFVMDDVGMRGLRLRSHNVLACFGIGAGEFVKNGHESETQLETMRILIEENGPRAVIVEACAPYWVKYLREPITDMLGKYQKSKEHNFLVEVPKPDIYHSRHMELWLRKEYR